MNRERVKKDAAINDLSGTVKYLKESKMNLNTELKKILQHRSQIAEEGRGVQQTLEREREEHQAQVAKLTIFENPEGLQELESNELEELETYLFRAIDTVKDVRIRKMIEQKGGEIGSPLKEYEGRGLFEILDIAPEKSILDETTNEDEKCVIEQDTETVIEKKNPELNGKPRSDEEVKETHESKETPAEVEEAKVMESDETVVTEATETKEVTESSD